MHHPWIVAVGAWWTLLSLTVRLDYGAFVVGLLPTLAIIVNYWLTSRKVGAVHVLVNNRASVQDARIAQLEDLLRHTDGVTVPATTRETGGL